jgi:hypothetical protein
MSEAERKWQLSVADLAELVKIVASERERYPEDTDAPQALMLNTLMTKLLFELRNPR